MPVYIASQALFDGLDTIPFLFPIIKATAFIFLLYLVKLFFSGVTNTSERNLHGKVVLATGGTSGVGEAVVRNLASRGAQIVLLTQHALGDPFLVDFVEDLRKDTGNELITAEHVDLASLHSVREFATKWIDNVPPRRLDLVVLCANTVSPGSKSGEIEATVEGIELHWQINYLANFHLLSILSPALRAQPPDRDVRIIFGTCSSYMAGDLSEHIDSSSITSKSKRRGASNRPPTSYPQSTPTNFQSSQAYKTSKLALTMFALAFQKHLATYKRPDNMPMNAKVFLVDPGFCRTPSTLRYLTRGSLLGLALYLLTYPFWWLILKSPEAGAQSFLYAAMEEKFRRSVAVEGEQGLAVTGGGWLVKECKDRTFLRAAVKEESAQSRLWEISQEMVIEGEKRGIEVRKRTKREEEERKEEREAAKQKVERKESGAKEQGRGTEGSRKSAKAVE